VQHINHAAGIVGSGTSQTSKRPVPKKEKNMSRLDIIRAWKDAAYRRSLTPDQLAALPANPAGAVELTEAEAAAVDGKMAYADCGSCHSHQPNCSSAAQAVSAKLI
jgi:mersacidin/lichenicidin family type 2 lantibiotic